MKDFDAILTGAGDDRSLVWIAPVGTPAPEQVFDADVMLDAGWRRAGHVHGVLYVADQAELDRAIAQKGTLDAALAEVGFEPAPRSAELKPYEG